MVSNPTPPQPVDLAKCVKEALLHCLTVTRAGKMERRLGWRSGLLCQLLIDAFGIIIRGLEMVYNTRVCDNNASFSRIAPSES